MKKIGKYDIIEELGHGGMGIVYKAYDSVMEREVAIKVMSELMGAHPDVRSRFLREARTAGKLTHENITVVYDVAEEGGRPYIVMEYLTGRDLATILASDEQIPFQQKLDFAIQICRGLSFLHSKDIVHRDIKPGNIRIIGGGRVKIMDFGIAKSAESNLTRTGAMIGTPFYMSPEQVQGRKVDKRSDIFSFGILFYELLTGKKPFNAEESTGVMFKIVFEEPEWLDDTLIDHRTGLREVVMKTLAKDPDQRFQDLSEVADILDAMLAELKATDRRRAEEQRLRIQKLIDEGKILLKGNKFKKAFESVERAGKLDPANTEVPRLLAQIREAEEREERRLFVEQRMQAARKAIAAKTFQKALELLQDVLRAEPTHPEALRLSRAAEDAIVFASTKDARYAETRVAGAEPLVPPAAPKPAEKVETPRPASPLPKKAEGPKTPVPGRKEAPSPERKKTIPLAVGAVVLLVAGLLLYRLFFYAPGGAASTSGYVSLNILPWAQITKITSEGGSDVKLGDETITPCRIALPEGAYAITLANPAFDKPLIVNVRVKNGEVQEVKEKFAGFDAQQILATFQ